MSVQEPARRAIGTQCGSPADPEARAGCQLDAVIVTAAAVDRIMPPLTLDALRPVEPARTSVKAHAGSPGWRAFAAPTRQRLRAADGGTRSVSGSTSKPTPPPASAASCSLRAATRSGVGPFRTRTAPATPGDRSASSKAHKPSFGRFAATRTRSVGERPKSLTPSGQMSGSPPIQMTGPAARARTSAQKPVAAPGFATSTSWKAARTMPPPGSSPSISGQSEIALASTVTLPRSRRATAARNSTRAAWCSRECAMCAISSAYPAECGRPGRARMMTNPDRRRWSVKRSAASPAAKSHPPRRGFPRSSKRKA